MRKIVAAIFILTLAWAGESLAQTLNLLTHDATGRPYSAEEFSHMGALEKSLAAKDYDGMTSLMLESDLALWAVTVNWSRQKLLAGGGILIVDLYARAMLRRIEEGDEDFRDGIGRMALYAIAIGHVDKAKCTYFLSATSRATNSLMRFWPQLRRVASLPPERKESLVERVLKLESDLAPLRAQDEYLCRGGRTSYYEALGFETPIPEPDRPTFMPRAFWEPKQVELRESLKAALEATLRNVQEVDLCASIARAAKPPAPKFPAPVC